MPYRSQSDDVMHVDMMVIQLHSCFLYNVAKTRASPGQLPRNVGFIFEPAEETGGGANRLIKAGAFDKYPIEAVFGIHVNPFADEGIAVIR
ncbi:M20/M25/M40 family metallo-hydrolase [Staphylococcus aureus]